LSHQPIQHRKPTDNNSSGKEIILDTHNTQTVLTAIFQVNLG